MSLPPPSSPDVESRQVSLGEFSPEERSLLLKLAHESILSALERREISVKPPSAHLAEARGVFTSLHLKGNLRGCVGFIVPINSVYRAVAETARAAAFEDTRFYPVTLEEARHLEIELSVLSPPQPVRAEDIEVGRHGLLISLDGRRGLLLPQVAVEHNWDRLTFLQQTCIKAGLASDAWRRGATIEVFTAEIFGDQQAAA
jgi:AmmeMemoRadiSam system protein A